MIFGPSEGISVSTGHSVARGAEIAVCATFSLSISPDADIQTPREFVKLKDGRGWLSVYNSNGDRDVVPLPQHRNSDSKVKTRGRNSVYLKKVSL